MPRQSKRKKPAASASKRGPGQPEKEIDLKQLETLCQLQCTDEEIAAFFGVSRKTIERRKEREDFRDAMHQGKLKGLVSLRRAQFQNALNGNATLQIWLGKQLLNQKDKHESPVEEKEPTTSIEYRWVSPAPEPKQDADPKSASDMKDKPEARVQ